MNTATNLAEEVKTIMAAEWQVKPDEIPDNAGMSVYEPWNSLGHISLLLALQNTYDFPLTPEVIQQVSTLPRILQFLNEQAVGEEA